MVELPNVAVHKPGSVLKSVAREVCAACNGGWMSRLETRTQPLLERMWTPHYPLGFTSLSLDEVSCVAVWAVKTAWVREQISDRTNTADTVRRRHLAETQTVPDLVSVWAARHLGPSDFHALTACIGVSHRDQHWETGEQRQVSLCALRFRGLAMIVRTDSGPGVPQFSPDPTAWRQLWPAVSGLTWPPPFSTADAHVDLLTQNISAWLQLPDTPRFERSGDWTHTQRN